MSDYDKMRKAITDMDRISIEDAASIELKSVLQHFMRSVYSILQDIHPEVN